MAVLNSSNPLNLYTSKILNYPDLLKNFLFQVQFQFNANTALYNLVKAIEQEHQYGGDSIGETLMLRARSISLPKKTTGKINTHYMGSLRNYAGRTKTDGDVTIKFDEFQDLATQEIFYEWQNLIYNHGAPDMSEATNAFPGVVETGGAVSDYIESYTAQVNIFIYDSALRTQLPFHWRLFDVFPTDNGNVSLDAEGESKVSPELTFNYNTWKMYRNSTSLVKESL